MTYPHIPNLIHLYRGGGIKGLKHVCDKLNSYPTKYISEKVDGINVSLSIDEGVLKLKSRGGRPIKDKERGSEFKWLLSFYHRHKEEISRLLCPGHVIYLEYVPPPEVRPPYLKFDYGKPFIAFLDLWVNKFIPYEWAEVIVSWLGNLGVRFIQHTEVEEVRCEQLIDLLKSLDRKSEYGPTRVEGFVIKAYSTKGHFYLKIKDEDLPLLKSLEGDY